LFYILEDYPFFCNEHEGTKFQNNGAHRLKSVACQNTIMLTALRTSNYTI